MSRRRGMIGLLAANGLSMLGTRMSMLAIPWFVLTTTGSAAETGIIAFAELAPYAVLMGIGGPWVDRIGAWRVAVASELSAGLLIGAVPLLHFTGHLSLPLLALLVAVAGGVRGAGDTGNRVLVPGLAEQAGALTAQLEALGTRLRDEHSTRRPGTAAVTFQFQVLPDAGGRVPASEGDGQEAGE
jgi:MFS family permease